MGMTLKDAQRFFEIDVEFLEREIDDCKNTSRTKDFLNSRIEAESIAIQALIAADSGRPFETRPAHWERPEGQYTPSCSTKFQCSACKGIVYYNHGLNAKKIKGPAKCAYPICPWCGVRIDEVSE